MGITGTLCAIMGVHEGIADSAKFIDMVLFFFAMIASGPISYPIKLIPSPRARLFYCIVFGILIEFYVFQLRIFIRRHSS